MSSINISEDHLRYYPITEPMIDSFPNEYKPTSKDQPIVPTQQTSTTSSSTFSSFSMFDQQSVTSPSSQGLSSLSPSPPLENVSLLSTPPSLTFSLSSTLNELNMQDYGTLPAMYFSALSPIRSLEEKEDTWMEIDIMHNKEESRAIWDKIDNDDSINLTFLLQFPCERFQLELLLSQCGWFDSRLFGACNQQLYVNAVYGSLHQRKVAIKKIQEKLGTLIAEALEPGSRNDNQNATIFSTIGAISPLLPTNLNENTLNPPRSPSPSQLISPIPKNPAAFLITIPVMTEVEDISSASHLETAEEGKSQQILLSSGENDLHDVDSHFAIVTLSQWTKNLNDGLCLAKAADIIVRILNHYLIRMVRNDESCRFVQRLFILSSPIKKFQITRLLLPYIVQLCKNAKANYMISLIIEWSKPSTRVVDNNIDGCEEFQEQCWKELTDELTRETKTFYGLCINRFSSFVMKKMVTNLRYSDQKQLLIKLSSTHGFVDNLSNHSIGKHVWKALLTAFKSYK